MPHLKDLKLINLIDDLIKSNPLMRNYSEEITEAILAHRFSPSLVIGLQRFQDMGLFSGELAKLNFLKVIRLHRPEELSEAMGVFVKTFGDSDINHPENARCIQAYFNQILRHDDSWFTTKTNTYSGGRFFSDNRIAHWIDIGITFKCLYFKTDLFKGPEARSNFNKLLTFDISHIATMLTNLQKYTDLLIGDYAQSNFDLLVRHKDVVSLLDALLLLVFWMPTGTMQGLLKGPLAQANFEAILHKTYLADALPRIYKMFNAQIGATAAQRLFDAEMLVDRPPTLHSHFIYKGKFFSDGLVNGSRRVVAEQKEESKEFSLLI